MEKEDLYGNLPGPSVWSGSKETEGAFIGGGATFGNAWPTSNLAMYSPIQIGGPFDATQMFITFGITAAGNVDVGVYNEGGVRLWSSGTTAVGSGMQKFTISPTLHLQPGRYYLAVAMSNTASNIGSFGSRIGRFFGMRSQLTAFPLPAVATFALPTTDLNPLIGIGNGNII